MTQHPRKPALTAEERGRFAELHVERAAYLNAYSHAQDDATMRAMEAHIDELFREECRVLGLPEDEIARIERESKAAVDKQIADEIATTLRALEP
jgi:hypothetical protein